MRRQEGPARGHTRLSLGLRPTAGSLEYQSFPQDSRASPGPAELEPGGSLETVHPTLRAHCQGVRRVRGSGQVLGAGPRGPGRGLVQGRRAALRRDPGPPASRGPRGAISRDRPAGGLWPLRVMGPLCPPRAPSRRGWPPSPARKAVGVATQVIPAAESASARTRSHGNVWAVLPVKFSAAGHLGGPSCTAHFTRQAGEGWGGPLVGRPLLGVSLLRAGPALQPLSHARCKQRPGVCLSRGVPGCPLGRPGSAPSPMGVHPAGGREDISVSGSTNRK